MLLDPIEANRLGIDKTTVASNLAMRFNDIPVTTIWEDDYPVAVKLKTGGGVRNRPLTSAMNIFIRLYLGYPSRCVRC